MQAAEALDNAEREIEALKSQQAQHAEEMANMQGALRMAESTKEYIDADGSAGGELNSLREKLQEVG